MKTNRGTPDSGSKAKIPRRSFLNFLPAAGLAAYAAALEDELFAAVAGAPPPAAQQQRITREMLQAAEQILGIDFTEAQESAALPGMNRNLGNYEALRRIDIPLDTELATAFHPAQPGLVAIPKTRGGRASRRARLGRSLALHMKPSPDSPLPPGEGLGVRARSEVAFFPLTHLAELIRTRKVSPVDLTQMYLSRLKKYGPQLLCVVTLTEDLAMQQAKQAEREIARGKYRGPLHGIPYGIKDLFATKGIPTQWGAEPFRNQVIDYDATVVERLREAGAVLVAKLSMGALAQGGRWFAGMTRNPWQIEEQNVGSSGSSAGSASATSAGLVGFSIGTETLGSIISPSSRCGVVGLRPTYGRISRYGGMVLCWTMDKVGPICRSVEDCAVVLNAIYGPDGRDISVGDVPFIWSTPTPLPLAGEGQGEGGLNLRIGYVKTEFEQGSDEGKKVLQEALDALRRAGAKLEPITLPQFPASNLLIILFAEASAAFDDITRDGRVDEIKQSNWPNSFRTARFIPAVEYLRAQRARTLLMREMDKLMSQWDCFISPAPGSASLVITNLTGHPQVCVPCGFVRGLPQSIMFTGRLYDEATPLRVAHAFEQATIWHKMHPMLD